MISIPYPPSPHFQGCALSGSDTSRKCLSLAYNLPQLCRFWGRFWVLCTLRLSLTLLALPPAALYLSACGTSDSLQIQSQLHDVSDTEYTFRLAPVDRSQYENYSLIGDEKGDPNAIIRFEMCLNDASANPIPQSCFNAFRNHRGEPIFFTIDAVSKAALTPEELSYVSGLESRWESFRQAYASRYIPSTSEEFLMIGSLAVGGFFWMFGLDQFMVRSSLDSIELDIGDIELDEYLAGMDQGLKKDFGVSKLDQVPGARKTLGSEVSLRQIYDKDFLEIIARKAEPFLEAQNVDLNKALSVPKLYLDGINAPGVVEESLEEFMKLAPDQNISHIVKPRYQKHFLEYVSAKQYFIPDTQKLWVPLRGDAQKRLGQMNEFFNKLVKQGLPVSNIKLAPTSTTLHNVMEFVVHRGQLPQLSREARLATRAYKRRGLRVLSEAQEKDLLVELKRYVDLMSDRMGGRPALRKSYRAIIARDVRRIGLVAMAVSAAFLGAAMVNASRIPQKYDPNDDPDLVPEEGLGDLGITPGNIDTFTIMADLGSAITSNEENVGVESAESVMRHLALYLETGFSRSSHPDASIAYVCLPMRLIGMTADDDRRFFRKCYED